MKKRILLLTAAFVAVAVGVVGMSAFEAHVINVTAKIENALSVLPYEIDFGTVFPQEKLYYEDLEIRLSSSFLEEERVDDIDYVIKQKPKVKGDPYAIIDPDPSTYPDGVMAHVYCLNEEPTDPGDPDDPYYVYCYPILCPYLSKTDADPEDENDGPDIPAFHEPDVTTGGHLSKADGDEVDLWTIDLDVPCFVGMCAQDWTHQGWELPAGLNSQIFGCDLWIEVTGVSFPPDEICGDGILDPGEQCDDGASNGILCVPPYDGSCFYCDVNCELVELFNGYCGDGEINGPEDCEYDADCDDEDAATMDTCVDCVCYNDLLCGNDVIDPGETCELPNTTDNSYCSQSTTQCDGNKTQTRDGYGDCDGICGCVDDPFGAPECVMGSCSATCAVDADCDDGIPESTDTCNLDTCQCEFGSYCGDGYQDPWEECDDGGTDPLDGCAADCTLEAQLTVTKDVINNHGGLLGIGDFDLFIDGNPITSSVTYWVSPGSHTVSESGVFGYSADIAGDCDSLGGITLLGGENKSCTITNDDIPPYITVVKAVSGGSAGPDEFDVSIDHVVKTSGSSNPVMANAAHIIDEETMVSGYSFTSLTGTSYLGVPCPTALEGTITLLPGDVVTCTITNTYP